VSVAGFLDRFPELEGDRVRIDAPTSTSRGMELMVRRAAGGPFSWSAAYGLAHAVDHTDTLDIPRTLDQTHTLRLDLGVAPNERWRFGASWELHSGWPYTTARFRADTLSNGLKRVTRDFPRVGDGRLPPYHRLDLRASYRRPLGRGELTMFLDAFNAYNRDNVHGFDYSVDLTPTRLIVTREPSTLLPLLPSVGVTWRF
jgi:outer membrane receptor protein involved in Fe transport